MASIQKKGSAYYVVYRDKQTRKQRWTAAGKTMREARRVLHDIEGRLLRGEPSELNKATFAEFVEIWLRDYPAIRGMKRSTLTDYRSAFRAHWLKAPFAHRDLTEITLQDLEAFVSARLADGVSRRRMADIIVPLKTCMKSAVRWRYLWTNPAQELKKPKYDRPEMDFLTPEEAHRLLEAVESHYRPMILFALMTGVRPGELIATRWKDVDLNNRLVSVQFTLDRGELLSPKTDNARRRIPLPAELVDALLQYRDEWPANPLGLVFVQPSGRHIDLSNFRNRVFKPALERAGIRSIRIYDLRHTYAAWMISLNVEPLQLSRNMGHYDLGFTYRTYGHLMPASGHDEAARLGAMFVDRRGDEEVSMESPACWLAEARTA